MEREYITKTIRLDGCTVILHRPILSDAERKKAEDRVRQALSCYGKG